MPKHSVKQHERHESHPGKDATKRLDKLHLFEGHEIRSVWVEDEEDWYFSVVDVVAVLTESKNPRNYWNMLKSRLRDEGSELYTACVQLKMQSAKDGKHYLTDAANTEQVLRLIQSIPSPKAEPFKLWLAQVGKDRIDETFDPELAIARAKAGYLASKTKPALQPRATKLHHRNCAAHRGFRHNATGSAPLGKDTLPTDRWRLARRAAPLIG